MDELIQITYLFLINLLYLIKINIGEGYISEHIKELEFRTNISYKTFHDLRNYLYSSTILIKETYFENNDIVDLNDDQRSILESNIFVTESMKYIYNLELIFNSSYNISIELIDTIELYSFINHKIRIYLVNKSVKVNTELSKTTFEQINIDKYFLNMTVITIVHYLNSYHPKFMRLKWYCDIVQGLNYEFVIEITIDNEISKNKIEKDLIEYFLINKIISCWNDELKDRKFYITSIDYGISIQIEMTNENKNNISERKLSSPLYDELIPNEGGIISEFSVIDYYLNEQDSSESILGVSTIKNSVFSNSKSIKIDNNIRRNSDGNINYRKFLNVSNNNKPFRRNSFQSFVTCDKIKIVENQSISKSDSQSPSVKKLKFRKLDTVHENDIANIFNNDGASFSASSDEISMISKNNNDEIRSFNIDENDRETSKIIDDEFNLDNFDFTDIDKNKGKETKQKTSVVGRRASIDYSMKLSSKGSSNKSKISKYNSVELKMESKKDNVIIIKSCFINVDDENCILNLNSRIFKKQGVELQTVKSGAQLEELLKEMAECEWFHSRSIMVIMDYSLEREFGDEVIAAARKSHLNRGNPFDLSFVALTSTEDKIVYQKFLDQKVKKIFTKPLKKSMVEEIIKLNCKEISK